MYKATHKSERISIVIPNWGKISMEGSRTDMGRFPGDDP